MKSPTPQHPSDSRVQRNAESEILQKVKDGLAIVSRQLPAALGSIRLDGFWMTAKGPVLVEVYARQGKLKAGNRHKILSDICKLLYAEQLLDTPCRKIIALGCEEAAGSIRAGWRGKFAESRGIEFLVVELSEDQRKEILDAQVRQFR